MTHELVYSDPGIRGGWSVRCSCGWFHNGSGAQVAVVAWGRHAADPTESVTPLVGF